MLNRRCKSLAQASKAEANFAKELGTCIRLFQEDNTGSVSWVTILKAECSDVLLIMSKLFCELYGCYYDGGLRVGLGFFFWPFPLPGR